MIGLSAKRDEILEIKEKQSELGRMIAKLESNQPRILEIPKQDIELKEGEHYAGIILGKEGEHYAGIILGKEGEHYAGIILGKEAGPSHHLILLPGESEVINWASALSWAKSVGGELPTRREQSLLYANLKDQFRPTGYWSSEQHAEHADYAWVQHFNYGDQYYYRKDSEWRARAVRRLIIQ